MDSCYTILGVSEDETNQSNVDTMYLSKIEAVESNLERQEIFDAYMLTTELLMFKKHNFDNLVKPVKQYSFCEYNMNTIILLHGLSRCGKDSVAEHISKNYPFEHVKVASHLKECVSKVFNIQLQCLEDDRKDMIDPYYNKTPREIMKFFGTDIGQYKLEELLPGTERCFWINHLIYHQMNRNTNYVISDYRFIHEYKALKQGFPRHNIIIIKIIPEFDGFVPPSEHESERSLGADYTVHNRDLSELYLDIDRIMKSI